MLIIAVILFVGCGGSDSDDAPTPPPMNGTDDEPAVPNPERATLVFPENNSECTTGIVNPANENLSTITFEWNASANTDSYTITVTNLNTSASVFFIANSTSSDITVERGVPYSWFVTSRANGTTFTTDSNIFRFYNEGPGIENYAPFPAEAVSPTRGQNLSGISSVNLIWTGSDIDNDIVDYEVFFGTNGAELPSIATVTDASLNDIEVISGKTYFWKVVTKDSVNNSSTSETFNFRVN